MLRILLLLPLLSQAAAFTPTATTLMQARTPVLRATSSVAAGRAARQRPLALRMDYNMLNLEGHYKPGEGYKPHMWKIDGDFSTGDPRYDLTCNSEGIAMTEVEIVPVSATYEDFVAGFTADSSPGWVVEPADGCLDCKGGGAEVLRVSFQGIMERAQFGTLVVVLPAENHSWTFKLKAAPHSNVSK